MEELIKEIHALRADINELQGQVKSLWSALVQESDNTTTHLRHLSRDLSGIKDRIGPVIERVFPEWGVAERKVAALRDRSSQD